MKDTRKKILEWLLNGETGISSKTIAAALCRIQYKENYHPRDWSDFNRCEKLYRILDEEEKRLALKRVSKISRTWELITYNWDWLIEEKSKEKINDFLDIVRVLK